VSDGFFDRLRPFDKLRMSGIKGGGKIKPARAL
jgi:hypothetical protein